MVGRPLRPCRRPGCPALVRGKPYCPDHQAANDRQRDEQRGNRHQRGYGNAWLRVSRQVLQRDGYICHYCGLPGATTADHVIPKAKGGSDDPSNLVAAHNPCNASKGKR